MADDSFVKTWGESSVFVLLANGKDTEPVPGKGKRWFALAFLMLMIVGATVGELPVVKEAFAEIKLDRSGHALWAKHLYYLLVDFLDSEWLVDVKMHKKIIPC